MDGPSILARTLSRPGKPDRYGNTWQYHSRSDRHSKIACWCILFEALQHSSTLRRHVDSGAVVFGVNQQMRDYRTNRTKDLDLVLATPGSTALTNAYPVTLADLAVRWSIRLSEDQQQKLAELPKIVEGPTGVVLAALEAKGEHPVASLTLLTTLLDFKEVGPLGVFIDPASVAQGQPARLQ